MKSSRTLIIMSSLAALFGGFQSAAGLFYTSGGNPFQFTTLHGEMVEIYGKGVYFFDSYFKAPILRGTDAVTLFLGVRLLIIALVLYIRGSVRGGLLLVGLLAYFLYISASIAMGVAYNNLFLLYIAFFSVSLFAFILAYKTMDTAASEQINEPGLPRKGIAVLLIVSGIALLFAWVGDILGPLLSGTIADMGSYTTEVTYVIDLGVIAPVSFLSAFLILKRNPTGFLLANIMLVTLAIVGIMVAAQTLSQNMAGITLTTGELIGKAGSPWFWH